MTLRRFIEGGGDDFAAHGTAHFGNLFGAFVNQKDDEFDVGIVGGNRMGDVLQHHGLTGFRRGHQQGALAAADGGNEVDGAAGQVFFRLDVAFQFELFGRKQRREVFKQDFVFAGFRIVAVDAVEPHQRKVALVVFRNAHAAFDGVAGMQVEAAYLARRHINIVGAGKIGSIGAAQEAETVGQDFERARAGEALALLHHLAHNGKHEVLFAQAVGIFDTVLLGHFQ